MTRARSLVLAGRSPLALRMAHVLAEQCGTAIGAPLLLAVSGGADSRALLLLAAALWKREDALDQLAVVSIDHGLRPLSAGESRSVEDFALSLGVSRVALRRVSVLRRGNLEAAARTARWTAIGEVMREFDIATVATAHHADDLFESFFFQLARKRGIDALRALPPIAPLPVRSAGERMLIRPLRSMRKRELVALLTRAGLQWDEDETNHSNQQFRAQMRHFLSLAGDALDPCIDGLAALAQECAQLEHAGARLPKSSSRASLRKLDPASRRSAITALLRDAGCIAPQQRVLASLMRAIADEEVRPREFRFRGARVLLQRTSLRAEAIA